MPARNTIFSELQQDILKMQGFKPSLHSGDVDPGLGPVNEAFPNATFPLGAVHELLVDNQESFAASGGFLAGILSSLMHKGGVCVWVSASAKVFPPALASFGLKPENIIFITLEKEKDILWTIEEALKCEGLAAVVGEVKELNFTASRRLQLAVEQSRVTGFILRQEGKRLQATATVCRWKITSLPGVVTDDFPGIGFPQWNIELLKVRNGKPGAWQLMWLNGKFKPVISDASILETQHRKTG